MHNQRFCSTPCRDRKLGARKRVNRGSTSHRGYDAEYRRNRPLALARDQWLCRMPHCKAAARAIRRDLPPWHPLSPSADHIIAPRHGGTNALDNLRASHVGCNSSAGAAHGNRERAGATAPTSSTPRVITW